MTAPILTDIGYDRFTAQMSALTRLIAASGWRPGHIVGVGRGGLVPATWLSHALDVPMLSIDLSAGIAAFADRLLDRLAERAEAGERLLIVDDINDSGRTIAGLRAKLGRAPPALLRFAVLIDNIASSVRVDYAAETIDRAVTKDWFVFPWEQRTGEAARLDGGDRGQD
ncbi:MAG: phosphoribosyltransferase family protein [Sphingobium sp.]